MFSLESFCNLVWGMSHAGVSFRITKGDYKEFVLPKKDGTRRINYLDNSSSLWELQNKLYSNFLKKQSLPVCVKGFIKGESYHSFLSEHIGSRFFVRLDIASFFPSITTEMIRCELDPLLVCDLADDKKKLLDLICDIVTLDNRLPQGACTSPFVSNLVMARLDQRITKYCQVFNIRYTRYADDLLFSSNSFNFSDKKWFIKKIKYILHSQGMELNYSKIKFGQDELILNGYVISDSGIRLSRNRLSDIRHVVTFSRDHYHLIEESGSDVFLCEANKLSLKYRNLRTYPFNTIFQFLQYMCGYRSFLISITDSHYESTAFQKELQRLIRRIEKQILQFS